MQYNPLTPASGLRGSVVLVTSTSGYFGSTGVGSYVASKHGITGLLRAAQQTARKLGIRINGVAPGFTPTPTFKALADRWRHSGLKWNTLECVAMAIALACSRDETGKCHLVLCLILLSPGSSLYADIYTDRWTNVRGSRRE